jgi:putative transposase
MVDLIAYVIMPNHLHLILYFKEISKLSDFIRDVKKFSSRNIRLELQKGKYLNILKQLEFQKGEQIYKVWQDRYDAKVIRSNDILITKIKYIHDNPVSKRLVERTEDWKSSSAGFYSGLESELPLKNAGEIM